MKPTEPDRAGELARALFDEVVVPLAEARRTAGALPYFPCAGDSGTASYFTPPDALVMKPADFEFPGGGTPEGLVEAVAAHWSAQGERGLAGMAPRLLAVAEALRREDAEGDGSVDILCYTMF